MSDDDDLMLAWLANKKFEELESYLNRGRQLANTPLEELRTRWIAEMRAWAKVFRGFDHSAHEDIEAEMKLREVEPPFDLVRQELNAVRGAAKKAGAELLNDPERRDAVDRDITAEIRQLENNAKNNKN